MANILDSWSVNEVFTSDGDSLMADDTVRGDDTLMGGVRGEDVGVGVGDDDEVLDEGNCADGDADSASPDDGEAPD